MKLPWKKIDPIELEKEELARCWTVEDLDSEARQALIKRYLELDEQQLKHEKIRAERSIDAKTLFNGGLTLGLALLTLNYEKFDIVRSKAANLWLRRKG